MWNFQNTASLLISCWIPHACTLSGALALVLVGSMACEVCLVVLAEFWDRGRAAFTSWGVLPCSFLWMSFVWNLHYFLLKWLVESRGDSAWAWSSLLEDFNNRFNFLVDMGPFLSPFDWLSIFCGSVFSVSSHLLCSFSLIGQPRSETILTSPGKLCAPPSHAGPSPLLPAPHSCSCRGVQLPTWSRPRTPLLPCSVQFALGFVHQHPLSVALCYFLHLQ